MNDLIYVFFLQPLYLLYITQIYSKFVAIICACTVHWFGILHLTLDAPKAVDSSTIEVTSKMVTSATVQWTPVENSHYPVNFYYLRLSTCDDSSNLQSCQLLHTFKSIDNTTAYTLDNLAPFTVYSLEVAAENSVGIGPYSDPIAVQCKSESHLLINLS